MYVVLVELANGGYYAIAASDSQERALLYARYIGRENNLVCFSRDIDNFPEGHLSISDNLENLDAGQGAAMIRNIKIMFHIEQWNKLPSVDIR